MKKGINPYKAGDIVSLFAERLVAVAKATGYTEEQISLTLDENLWHVCTIKGSTCGLSHIPTGYKLAVESSDISSRKTTGIFDRDFQNSTVFSAAIQIGLMLDLEESEAFAIYSETSALDAAIAAGGQE